MSEGGPHIAALAPDLQARVVSPFPSIAAPSLASLLTPLLFAMKTDSKRRRRRNVDRVGKMSADAPHSSGSSSGVPRGGGRAVSAPRLACPPLVQLGSKGKKSRKVLKSGSEDITAAEGGNGAPAGEEDLTQSTSDARNYALLILLYTLQGIPMGLTASLPFLIQQRFKQIASAAATAASATGDPASAALSASLAHAALSQSSGAVTSAAYSAQAVFALCSWPFSLKLLWAPIVDACFFTRVGRRKSWLVPAQALAGIMMVYGANFVGELMEGTGVQLHR